MKITDVFLLRIRSSNVSQKTCTLSIHPIMVMQKESVENTVAVMLMGLLVLLWCCGVAVLCIDDGVQVESLKKIIVFY